MCTLFNNQKGQTVLELIIAITILVVALVATLVLIVTSINASREARNKLIATNLAREGIEVIRNIRDSNWVDSTLQCNDPTCSNETDCTDPVASGGCESVWGMSLWNRELIDDSALVTASAIPIITNSDATMLDFGADSFDATDYTRVRTEDAQYLQGDANIIGNSEFYRMLYLYPICQNAAGDQEYEIDNTSGNDCLSAGYEEVGVKVVAEVRWPQHDSNKKVIIEDHLYNWQTL